jgi:hypothetical protein
MDTFDGLQFQRGLDPPADRTALVKYWSNTGQTMVKQWSNTADRTAEPSAAASVSLSRRLRASDLTGFDRCLTSV